jgi:hypothetical protein
MVKIPTRGVVYMKIISRVIIVILLAMIIASGMVFAFESQEREYNGIFVWTGVGNGIGHIHQAGKEGEHGGMFPGVG